MFIFEKKICKRKVFFIFPENKNCAIVSNGRLTAFKTVKNIVKAPPANYFANDQLVFALQI